MTRIITSVVVILVLCQILEGQSIGINTLTPDSSAVLDIQSSDKGILIPRVNTSQRTSISNPANGLLVYDEELNSFYYFNDENWVDLSTSEKDIWYQEGTLLPADSLNANMYHMGNLAIGKDTTEAVLDIYSTNETGVILFQENVNEIVPKSLYLKLNSDSSHQQQGIRQELTGSANSRIGSITVSTSNDSITSWVYGDWMDLNYSSSINDSIGRQLVGSYHKLLGFDNIYQAGVYNDLSGSSYGNQRGTLNRLRASGDGEHIGTYNSLESSLGEGDHIGTKNEVKGRGFLFGSFQDMDGSSDSAVYAIHNTVDVNGDGQHFGVYSEFDSSFGDGENYGVYSVINGNGDGMHYGQYNKISGSGTAKQYGSYNLIDNTGSNFHYGTLNSLTGTGTGPQYGTFQSINNTGNDLHVGTQNSLSGTGGGTQRGVRNSISVSGDGDHYGMENTLSGSGIGIHHGVVNNLTGAGTGSQIGVKNEISNSGDGDHTGVETTLSGAGTGSHIGDDIYLEGTGAGAQVGNQTTITNEGNGSHWGSRIFIEGSGHGQQMGNAIFLSNSGTGNHYGTYNDMSGDNAAFQTGTFNILQGASDGPQVAISNSVISTGSGLQYGVNNVLDNLANGTKYGTYNYIKGGGDGTHYASYNRISSTGSGDHVASYFSATGGGNNYAAVFHQGDVLVNNIGGDYDFRIKSDDLTNMFFVDADVNRIGVGTETPKEMLDIRGTTQISSNSGLSTPQLRLEEDGNDYSRLTFSNKSINTANYWTLAGQVNAFDSLSRLNFFYKDFGNVLNLYGDGRVYLPHRLGIGDATPDAAFDIHSNLDEDPMHVQVGNASKMRIYQNGSIALGGTFSGSTDDVFVVNQMGMGVSAPTHRLEIENNANPLFGTGRANAWITYSDARVKRNVRNTKYGLDDVLALRSVEYDHHSSTFGENGLEVKDEHSSEVGFIAQEVYEIIQEVVHKPEDEELDLWSLNYEKLTPVLVKAIQELATKNNLLDQQVAEQNSKFQKMEERQARLEKMLLDLQEGSN